MDDDNGEQDAILLASLSYSVRSLSASASSIFAAGRCAGGPSRMRLRSAKLARYFVPCHGRCVCFSLPRYLTKVFFLPHFPSFIPCLLHHSVRLQLFPPHCGSESGL